MARFDHHAGFHSPEYFDAGKRGGLPALVDYARSYLNRMELEGDEEDIYVALYELASLVLMKQDDAEFRQIAERMLALPCPRPQLALYKARTCYERLEDGELSLRFVQSGYDSYKRSIPAWDDRPYLVNLKKLELAIWVDRDPHGETTGSVLLQLWSLMTGREGSENIIEIILKLAKAGGSEYTCRSILAAEWGQLTAVELWTTPHPDRRDAIARLETAIDSIPNISPPWLAAIDKVRQEEEGQS